MNPRPLAAVVLAAGQGKRLKAPVPKVLVPACGRALVEHVLEALRPIGAHPTVVVYGHGGDLVRRALADRDLRFAHQPEQRGTGHAVQCALPELDGFDGDVLVLCGDTPLLRAEVLRELVDDHRAAGRALTVLSAEMSEPGSLGRILRDGSGALTAIREAADATDAERAVREINTGVIVVAHEHLAAALERLSPDNAQGELYLTDVPGLLLADGLTVGAYRTLDEGSALGVNRPAELAEATALLRARLVAELMGNGVRVEDPATAVVDSGATVGLGTVLGPFVCLGGDVRIGPGCEVGSHAVLRGGTVVGEKTRIGAHAELFACTVADGARVGGGARLAGTALGRGAVVGGGCVTEGEGRIVIGEGARVGAGTTLVAPATVSEGARIEPGGVVGTGSRGGE